MTELPRDVPRLRSIERYLLVQLAAVQRALQEAENSITTKPDSSPPRWGIAWKRAPVGQTRVGILHRADCWMAPRELLDARAVFEARRQEGRRIEPCDSCKPHLP
ncbi:hypothetical protein [Streptomyces sp. NPDC053560]|uniref:hypothetical protein n=1 Tax=Streptomyces sp. NPDC053560 TaxID=3365711 RepID=UPI0037D36784